MTTVSALSATGLCKSFGEHRVLDGISLEVPAGSVFALLGPNGAGKTTTVRIFATLLAADAGTVRVAGHDVRAERRAVRRTIGVTGQFAAIDDLLTARENLVLMADLRHLGRTVGRWRVGELLDVFELADAADRPVSTFSGGMRRRLDLAMTLVGDPRIVFLDEPTSGLDPRSRRTMWDLVRGLVARGATVLLTTQYLEEADRLADRVAVLDRGRLVAEGTPEQLKRRVPGGHVRLRFADRTAFDRAAGGVPDGIADVDALTLEVPSDGSVGAIRVLLGRLDALGVELEDLTVHSPDLDDVFLALTDPRPAQEKA